MTQSKPTYTHIQTSRHARPIPITNAMISGSRFIKDTKTLVDYCREWLDATRAQNFTCIAMPAVQTYLIINTQGDVHFVQFAYKKSFLSPTQIAFRTRLNKMGKKMHIFNDFQSFANFINKAEGGAESTSPVVFETERPKLTAWGIQLPVGTVM